MPAGGGRAGMASPDISYIEGNTVRYAAGPVPVSMPQRQLSRQASWNRERALAMNLRYVVFLSVAAVLAVMVCVNYLKLQSSYTALQKEATRMETQLNTLRIENDTEYNRIMSSVNLEEIKQAAIGRLGMVYVKKEQIETYDASGRDYARQYMEVPDV